jgi:dolichol-phosphate mannosyltransferase
MDKFNSYKFSIVLFAKDEDRNIFFIINQLLQRYEADKIIAVLDGNIEPTASMLREKNVRFIQGPNKGKGAALRIAIESIESDIFVFIDADGSHNPDEIERLLEPLMNNEAELVIASRFLGGSEELSGSIENSIRRLGNILSNYVINFLWNRNKKRISDSQNGFRAIKKEATLGLNLNENGFSIEQEMVIKCLKKGYRIVEVPSFESRRKYGNSHIPKFHTCYYIGCIVKNLFKR